MAKRATKTSAGEQNTPLTDTPNLPANTSSTALVAVDDLSAFDGGPTGFENVTSRDLLIPRIGILQGLSPAVSPGKPEYNPEARPGEIYDHGLQERFPNGIVFIPVYYVMQWLEWFPRNTGKGLAKIHDTDAILSETVEDEKGRAVLQNGNYIAETAQFYGMNVTAGFRKSFIPMPSTQLKKARRLLTLSTSEKLKRGDGSEFTPPLWYRSYALTTVPESNAEGNWMGWKIERGAALSDYANWRSILDDIKAFREQCVKGMVRGDLSNLDGGDASPAAAGSATAERM